ncbi:alpha-ketoglutarate-dependent dioxygenase AlkB [Alteromonas sp. KUL49]|uniref:alpha-ketoglutarate-dependent dioxygenase AlkB family protein n=1 Tax=Alteromonas sp. KUL49 TaxID=2480798 RepID=UPI00102EE96C|nr:alpha-ketoglutarate-dependent dioxygenase AlkB [Alteromonas sp. KUL49]TAP40801.1 alpha-ketoglutarate-dependent dioxygenase AlkB [Alteromonas sp. KUL49]GEA10977.1 DNA methylase [Alteromonas sp. KUL49]
MDLFEKLEDSRQNLLPYDGTVHYYGNVMSQKDAGELYSSLLMTIDWQNDRSMIFGKEIITKRKVAWYGDKPFSYTYSKVTKTALPWTPELKVLKNLAQEETGETYNSCLLNLYHDGSEGMSWHSDGEKELKKNGAIASMSLGAQRKFAFKHKRTKETIAQFLGHGSLLVMKDDTQAHWLHRLPPMKAVTTPRINLTFRTIVDRY